MSLALHLAAHLLAAGAAGHEAPAAAVALPAHAPLALAAADPAVPNPAATPPPGLTGPVTTILGWIKWGAIVAGSVGMSACGLMMILGRRNRSSLAVDGAAGIPYVLLGLIVVSAGSAIAGAFL